MKALEVWRLKGPEWFADTVINFRPDEGEGWSEIVGAVLTSIERVLGFNPEVRFGVGQVKEKTGSLRLYFRIEPDDADLRRLIEDCVEDARLMSAKTCMICGVEGSVSQTPWCMLALHEVTCPNRCAFHLVAQTSPH